MNSCALLRCSLHPDYCSMFRSSCNSSSSDHAPPSADSTIEAELVLSPSPSPSPTSSASSSSSRSALSGAMMCREIREYDFLRCMEESAARSTAENGDVDCTLHLGTGRSAGSSQAAAWTSAIAARGGARSLSKVGSQWQQHLPARDEIGGDGRGRSRELDGAMASVRPLPLPASPGMGGFTREANLMVVPPIRGPSFPWPQLHHQHQRNPHTHQHQHQHQHQHPHPHPHHGDMLNVLGSFPTLPLGFPSPIVPASSRGGDRSSSSSSNSAANPTPASSCVPPNFVIRICAQCKTMRTPLWRNGPQGPKSLCNACGIRYKKEERRAAAAAATDSFNNNASNTTATTAKPDKCQPSDVASELQGARFSGAICEQVLPRFSDASWPPPQPQLQPEKRAKLGPAAGLQL